MYTRKSIVSLLAFSAAALLGQTTNQTTTITDTVPTLFLDLDHFNGIKIKRGKDEIFITPKELWEALNG